MNIKFGMNNFYVRYLKRFLNNELSKSSSVLGKFDQKDLVNLIEYLNLPNVKSMFEVETEILETFPELTSLFSHILKDNDIIWTSKTISNEASEFLINNIEDIKDYCESVGWELNNIQEWIDISKDINGDGSVDEEDRAILYDIITGGREHYSEDIIKKADLNQDGLVNEDDLTILSDYLETGKLKLEIRQSSRKNYFPNKDMLIFINQFTGNFLYNYAITGDRQSGTSRDDMPHKDGTNLHKIALYQCKPGQKVTIAHNSSKSVHLVVASSSATLKADLTNIVLTDIEEIDLKQGEGYNYTCSDTAKWLLIECPSDYENVNGNKTKTVALDVGDINFDGKIDMLDYHLLARYTAEGAGAEQLDWEPTSKQLAVMNVDVDHPNVGKHGNGINNYDTLKLWKFLNNDPTVPSLGFVYYTYDTPGSPGDIENVNNLLIIDGHYGTVTKDGYTSEFKSYNVPFNEFTTNDWVIHEKFFNYLLNIAVHKYSNSEDITYLQKLLKELYPEDNFVQNTFYPGSYSDYMREIVWNYQKSKIHYVQGDLNLDGYINHTDLELLRTYLDEVEKINLIEKYIAGEVELTPEQIIELDENKDGRVDAKDEAIIQARIDSTYSSTFVYRADTNKDGLYNEDDYNILEQEVNGTSDYLKNYDITFNLGWYDVQTEGLLESEVNSTGLISEVSK